MTDASALISTAYSRYLARAAVARPELAARIAAWAAAPVGRAAIEARLTELLDAVAGGPGHPIGEEPLRRALRQLRIEVFGAVAERDLAGLADVAEVTGAMTDLAEATLQRSLAVLSMRPPAVPAAMRRSGLPGTAFKPVLRTPRPKVSATA